MTTISIGRNQFQIGYIYTPLVLKTLRVTNKNTVQNYMKSRYCL